MPSELRMLAPMTTADAQLREILADEFVHLPVEILGRSVHRPRVKTSILC